MISVLVNREQCLTIHRPTFEITNSLQGIHQLNGLLSNTIRRKKKAFGDSISDWSQTKGLESTYIYPRDSNGVRVDENSTEAYSGYAKCKFQHFV